jgi:hypothetical protein
MANVVAERLGAIRRLKELKASPSPFVHKEMEELHKKHPWLLDWNRYVPIKKREAALQETATADASKANAPAQLAALKDLNTLQELETKYPEFKQAFPLPGGRRRRTQKRKSARRTRRR